MDYEQFVKDQELVDEYIRSVGGNRDVAPIYDGVVDPSIYAELTYSHGQAHGNLAMVTTVASRRMSYTVSGPRVPSGLALWFRRPSPVPFDS